MLPCRLALCLLGFRGFSWETNRGPFNKLSFYVFMCFYVSELTYLLGHLSVLLFWVYTLKVVTDKSQTHGHLLLP